MDLKQIAKELDGMFWPPALSAYDCSEEQRTGILIELALLRSRQKVGEYAEKLGYTRQHFSELKNGRTRIERLALGTATVIAETLGIDADTLLQISKGQYVPKEMP